MNDLNRHELALLGRTLLKGGPVATGCLTALVSASCLLPVLYLLGPIGVSPFLAPLVFGAGAWVLSASLTRGNYRFRYGQYRQLWARIEDRVRRFEKAYRRSPRILKDTLSDTPSSVERLVHAIYLALLRADHVRHMLEETEPPDTPLRRQSHKPTAYDEHAKDLYTLAEQSREDYKQQYRRMMAGVERTEAQADLLVSSLDNLRLRLLDYRVTGAKVEMPSDELIERLRQHRTELTALEKAVEELEVEFRKT